MKHLSKLTLLLFLAISVISCSSSNEEDAGSINGLTDYETEILKLLNNYRTSLGLEELEVLEAIKPHTDSHTDHMISTNIIDHANGDIRAADLFKNAGAVKFGENVAAGQTTAQSVVTDWINSDGHRRNIVGDFTHFNITAKQNSSNRWYYTNIFVKK